MSIKEVWGGEGMGRWGDEGDFRGINNEGLSADSGDRDR